MVGPAETSPCTIFCNLSTNQEYYLIEASKWIAGILAFILFLCALDKYLDKQAKAKKAKRLADEKNK